MSPSTTLPITLTIHSINNPILPYKTMNDEDNCFESEGTYHCTTTVMNKYSCKDFTNLTVGLLTQAEDQTKDPPSSTLESTTRGESPTQVFLESLDEEQKVSYMCSICIWKNLRSIKLTPLSLLFSKISNRRRKTKMEVKKTHMTIVVGLQNAGA